VEVMKRFLDAYGSEMEFCQIQLNYLDWNFQNARGKVELLKEWKLPVWVMEPLRGGRLAKLSDDDEGKLLALRPEEKIPAWAFRFLQTLPEVTMILSGMSDLTQLKENVHTFETEKPLSEQEMETLLKIADGLLGGTLPCTACHYCVSHCPQELDIPKLLGLYNEHCFTGGGFLAPMALSAEPEEKKPWIYGHGLYRLAARVLPEDEFNRLPMPNYKTFCKEYAQWCNSHHEPLQLYAPFPEPVAFLNDMFTANYRSYPWIGLDEVPCHLIPPEWGELLYL